jgi:hypothetical protein
MLDTLCASSVLALRLCGETSSSHPLIRNAEKDGSNREKIIA